jgi:hypothetical protein
MLNPMDFPCPACGAKPGEKCQTISLKAMPKPHAKRLRAALNAEHPPERMSPAPVPIAQDNKDIQQR